MLEDIGVEWIDIAIIAGWLLIDYIARTSAPVRLARRRIVRPYLGETDYRVARERRIE